MKIKQKSLKRPLLVATICLLLIGVGTAGTFWYLNRNNNTNNQMQISPEHKDKANNSDTTNTQKKNEFTPSANTNVDTSKTTNQIPKSDAITVEITDLKSTNDQVTYSAKSNNNSNGTCAATFTNNIGKPVIRTTQAINGVCGPVDIPVLEFDALGSWTLTLRYYVNGEQAIATKEVEIN